MSFHMQLRALPFSEVPDDYASTLELMLSAW